MKLELIREHLTQCEQALEENAFQRAAEQACLTARLLMLRTAEWQEESRPEDLMKDWISLVGVAGAVQSRMEVLTARQDPAGLPANLQSRLAGIKEDLAGTEAEYQLLAQLNQEILENETALRDEKKKLEDLKKKLKELTDIKEKELKKLREDTASQKKKLEQLEKEYTSCEEQYKAVQAEMEENLNILARLPETTGADTLDTLIERAKQTRETLEGARENSGDSIREIIAEVQRLRKLAEGNP